MQEENLRKRHLLPLQQIVLGLQHQRLMPAWRVTQSITARTLQMTPHKVMLRAGPSQHQMWLLQPQRVTLALQILGIPP
ncbi:hypothetical protein A6O24_15225 [Acidithiobacillus thiooxidans]|nr:hypothetical protein A6O24_15225 [Acidithiobacillus thiooxidans]